MTTQKELLEKVAQLEQQNEALLFRIASNRTTKETSEYFVNAKSREFLAYKHLSETKRHFEQKHEELLKQVCEYLDSENLTSKQFNELLALAVNEFIENQTEKEEYYKRITKTATEE